LASQIEVAILLARDHTDRFWTVVPLTTEMESPKDPRLSTRLSEVAELARRSISRRCKIKIEGRLVRLSEVVYETPWLMSSWRSRNGESIIAVVFCPDTLAYRPANF
jgi:hypothetical protein